MQLSSVNQYFGNVDIYLLDLILKNRFPLGMKVLDAGCGEGRNLVYFLNAGFNVFGVDIDPTAINAVRFLAGSIRPDLGKEQFQLADLENLSYDDNYFELIISSAVLHFANSDNHFNKMFAELIRCLKPQGTLFIRMTSNIGIEKLALAKGNGRFLIPDGTVRYLMTREKIKELIDTYSLEFKEPLKTVNVDDKRCMTTIVVSIN